MRPTQPLDQFEARSRKPSITEPSQSTPPSDRQITGPTTFFLSRGPDSPKSIPDQQHDSSLHSADPLSSLQDAVDDANRRPKQAAPRILEGQQRPSSRRRSTIKPVSAERNRRRSSTTAQRTTYEPIDRTTTPSPFASQNVSLPSSPKSASSQPNPRLDEDIISDDAASQAIASSEDDEDIRVEAVQDSQPELIMPSIKMPSRRPFTSRGKRLGRFKILVAGHKGQALNFLTEQH
jgi:hypothetical protein